MSKTVRMLMTAVLAGAFLAAGFSAGADPFVPPPADLDTLWLLHEQYADWEDVDPVKPPQAVMEEVNRWATPFQWGLAEDNYARAMPLAGASWWLATTETASGAGSVLENVLAGFDIYYYTDDGGAPGTLIHDQELRFGDGQLEYVPPTGQQIGGSQWDMFRVGSSRSIGYDIWNPGIYIDPGDTLWFSVVAQVDPDWEAASVRWLRGVDPPTYGEAMYYAHQWNSVTGVWDEEENIYLSHSQHVVPEPTSMVLLGLGLTGFATRRLLSRKKKA